MKPGRVIVVGGANVDIKVQTLERAVPGTSNPGRASRALGGVGRNVAETLARLGVPVSLISAVGSDALGEELLQVTAGAGVEVGRVLRVPGALTGTYTAVLDVSGELLIAVAAMDVMDALTPAALKACQALFGGAAWIVADGNLSEEALSRVLELGAGAGVQVAFEPVSVPKAGRLLPALRAGLTPHMVTPNVAELSALVGRSVDDTPASIRGAALILHRQGMQTVWVRRGAQGSLLSTSEGWHALQALSADVVDVTGAGDAMLAAFLAARLAGESELRAAQYGHAAAALTVESSLTVVPDLSLDRLRSHLASYPEGS